MAKVLCAFCVGECHPPATSSFHLVVDASSQLLCLASPLVFQFLFSRGGEMGVMARMVAILEAQRVGKELWFPVHDKFIRREVPE